MEIIESIKILNETINSNFLEINDFKIDMNIFKKMIKEKKNKEKKYEEIKISPSTSYQKSQSSSSSSSSSYTINDSIEVTNFTIPSSIYKSSNVNVSTNAQTTISNL
jgi:hypothetical protein